jgi:PIN domain nuclease of toxin-antitoxin system
MSYLLDTHIALWWWMDSPRLDDSLRRVMSNSENTLYFSAVSALEITTKARLGKLTLRGKIKEDLMAAVMLSGWKELPVSIQHGTKAGGYYQEHRDPFDRLLAAQAETESLTLLTTDPAFQHFQVRLFPD